jgi:hypothetical protein
MSRLYLTPNTKEGFINVNPNLPQSLDMCTEPMKWLVQWHIATVKYFLYISSVNLSQNHHRHDHHPCCWLNNTRHMLHEIIVKYNYFLYAISLLGKIFKFLQIETCKTWGFHDGTMKNTVFWVVGPCRSCVNRRFGGTYCLHLQGRKICERGTSVSRWQSVGMRYEEWQKKCGRSRTSPSWSCYSVICLENWENQEKRNQDNCLRTRELPHV